MSGATSPTKNVQRLLCLKVEDSEFRSDTSGGAVTVVTHDGILLAKSGTMTGGVSGGMESRSQKWDNQAVEGKNIVKPIYIRIA